MSRFRFQITMTLDGYIAGPNQRRENPLGENGHRIHEWVYKLKTFREMHGDAGGGNTGPDDEVLREAFTNIGATIKGRNMFGAIRAAGAPTRGGDGGETTRHSTRRSSC
jgi:hypothetical protein